MAHRSIMRHFNGKILRLKALLPLLFALFLLFGPIPSVLSPQSSVLGAPEGPALLLGVGDSLMVGVGASLPESRGEFGLVTDLMRGRYGPNLRAVNVAIPGETSTTLLAPAPPPAPAAGAPTPTPIRPQIAQALDELGRLPAGGQAVVMLSIGGNDLQRLAGKDAPAREAALATFRTNLTEAVRRLTEDGQTRTLLIQTVYDPYGGDPSAVGSDTWWVERFNGAIRDIAGTQPIARVVELANKVRGNEQALTLVRFDDVHLSNAGHRLAADLYWSVGGFDTAPPDVTLVAPAAGNAPHPVLTVRATVTDDSGPNGVARVVLLADGQEQGELMPRPDLAPNTWLGLWDGRFVPGPHTIGVAAIDRAGNRREATVSVMVGATS